MHHNPHMANAAIFYKTGDGPGTHHWSYPIMQSLASIIDNPMYFTCVNENIHPGDLITLNRYEGKQPMFAGPQPGIHALKESITCRVYRSSKKAVDLIRLDYTYSDADADWAAQQTGKTIDEPVFIAEPEPEVPMLKRGPGRPRKAA